MAKKSWPYPVLDMDSEDYPNCAFQAAVDISQTRTEFVGSVNMDLGSESLLKAVDGGKAVYAVQIHCPRTSYRQIQKSANQQFGFTLPEGVLRGDFTVQPFVLSERKWELASSEFADLFKGMQFPVERGYVLAIAPQIIFHADKRLDDLKSVKAIFHVIRNHDPNKKEVEFDFEDERIGIVLSAEDHQRFSLFSKISPYKELFVCSLVLPALAQALVYLKEKDDRGDESAPRWTRVLRRCLKERGESEYVKERSFEVAQKILKTPFSRALDAVNAIQSEK